MRKVDIDNKLTDDLDVDLMSLAVGNEVEVRVYDDEDIEMYDDDGVKTTWGAYKASSNRYNDKVPIGIFLNGNTTVKEYTNRHLIVVSI